MVQVTLLYDQVILHKVRQLCRIPAGVDAGILAVEAAGTRGRCVVDLRPRSRAVIVGLRAMPQEVLEAEVIVLATFAIHLLTCKTSPPFQVTSFRYVKKQNDWVVRGKVIPSGCDWKRLEKRKKTNLTCRLFRVDATPVEAVRRRRRIPASSMLRASGSHLLVGRRGRREDGLSIGGLVLRIFAQRR